jgi:hypothetical protein
MKKPLIARGIVAAGVAVSMLPHDKRGSLDQVARSIMERCP